MSNEGKFLKVAATFFVTILSIVLWFEIYIPSLLSGAILYPFAYLNTGNKIVIQEEDGRFYFDNAALVSFKRVENSFKGAAKDTGFDSEDAMQDYMLDIRKEVRGY